MEDVVVVVELVERDFCVSLAMLSFITNSHALVYFLDFEKMNTAKSGRMARATHAHKMARTGNELKPIPVTVADSGL